MLKGYTMIQGKGHWLLVFGLVR